MSHFKTFADWCYRRGYFKKRIEFERRGSKMARQNQVRFTETESC